MEADKDLVESTFLDLTFDGKHVTKQALYDHIMTVAGFTKEEAIDEQLKRKQQERAKLDLEIAKKKSEAARLSNGPEGQEEKNEDAALEAEIEAAEAAENERVR